MRRNTYYTYIEEKLHVLSRRIESRGKLNFLDLHLHAENFYFHFFNLLYSYELVNMNKILQNAEAIDLIDKKNKIIIQVSATSTKQKIESALGKKSLTDYSDYSFKFISISKDASDLRTKTFKNPYKLPFNPSSDIFDINSILNDILSRKAINQKPLYDFIKSELGGEVDISKIETNLASIINVLSNEDWDDSNKIDNIDSFEIERKIVHNKLDRTRLIITENALFYTKVDSIYKEFDKQGLNKSNSVLGKIKREFLKLFDKNDPDGSFQKTVDILVSKVTESINFDEIPFDELELCIEILTVDAFIRCKIFDNPKNYKYATT
ncbi:ABC-three component system protein [Aquimarina sp. AU58]|uniref:ABC-three component system protein n=1 Tax=Aquimarina sp. AU58 TaxID=1874112 RepID=UPI000D6DC6EC|nr:ABC-three component system protein [Aquimarina sp. AU58]